MDLPTTRQLECFVAVAKTLHFRQAAELCHVTQPALSAQIQQLEALLGVRLFERDRRSVLLTAAGALLVERSRGILGDLRELAEASAQFKQPLCGTLRLGVIPTVAPYLLPRALRAVHKRYPQLQVLLREDQTARLLERLTEGDLDVLLLALEVELGDVETLPLLTDPFLLAVPPGHRLARRKRVKERDLDDEQLLFLDDGHCLRDQALAVCARNGAREVDDFRATSLATLVQMVCGGVGMTLLPELAAKVEAKAESRLTLIPFAGKKPGRTIGLAWRSSSLRSPEFELFGEAVRSALG